MTDTMTEAEVQNDKEAIKAFKAAEKEAAKAERDRIREKAAALRAIPKFCRCGCGTQTKSAFAPGHDAKYVGVVARGVVNGTHTLDMLDEFPKLRLKAERMIANGIVTDEEKAAKEAVKAAAKAEKAEEREIAKQLKAADRSAKAAERAAAKSADRGINVGDEVTVKIGRAWVPGVLTAKDDKGNHVVSYMNSNDDVVESVFLASSVRIPAVQN
jgi:hypothetical protein